MVKLLKLKIILAFLAGLLFFSSESIAKAREAQFHARVGQLNGKYSGTFKGSFETSGALDIDFEFFMNNDSSYFFRFSQALSSEDSRPFYTYAGSGARYYFSGKGTAVTQEDPGLFISAQPKVRFYVGGDVGIAQVIVKTFGSIVQSPANMLEVGANVGAIYQLTKRFGLEAHAGGTVGYGISSVAVNGSTVRAFLGGAYYF